MNENKMQHAAWCRHGVLYEMNIRQFTPEGTFAAARQRLPFLRDLGIDTVWLMPIYPIGEQGRKGSLGSFYSVRDYCAVNPEFGSAQDLHRFIDQAHALGMHVILDWVANHTSRDAVWLATKPADWYERDADGSPLVPWDWTDTAKLNYANHDVWQGQIDAMSYWVREFGVDGFRCDMAMLVPIEFWRETAAALRALRPDLFMLAEAEETNLFDGVFDACYAWEMFHILSDIAQGSRRTGDLRSYIYTDRERYPDDAFRLMFTSNHDENSWSGSEFARMGAAAEIMAVTTFLLPRSMPLLYTGQEVGCDHRFEFFERDPLTHYEPDSHTELYRRLIELKHTNAAMSSGDDGTSFVEIRNNAEDCLLTFVRERDSHRVVAILNLSPYTVQADFGTGIYAGTYTDALRGGKWQLHEHVWHILAPWEYIVLSK